MEGDGLKAEQFNEGSREKMLRGVLLHVVDAAGPVNLAVDWAGGNFCGGVVDHVVRFAWAGDV
jgi:hypothetical protein